MYFSSHYKQKLENYYIIINPNNLSHHNPIINNYKFYNQTENPFISIILDFSEVNVNKDNLVNFIEDFLEKTPNDTKFFFICISTNDIIKNAKLDLIFNEKRIETYKSDNTNMIERFFVLINFIKSKFLILIDEIIRFKKDEFYKIYNKTKGNIDNVFKIETIDKHNIYLIRTKVLREIIDKEKEFQDLNDLIFIFQIEIFFLG